MILSTQFSYIPTYNMTRLEIDKSLNTFLHLYAPGHTLGIFLRESCLILRPLEIFHFMWKDIYDYYCSISLTHHITFIHGVSEGTHPGNVSDDRSCCFHRTAGSPACDSASTVILQQKKNQSFKLIISDG